LLKQAYIDGMKAGAEMFSWTNDEGEVVVGTGRETLNDKLAEIDYDGHEWIYGANVPRAVD